MQFYQNEAAYVKFDYNIPRGASIGVYARRNALPTHTQYHFKEVLSGINPSPNLNPTRVARSTHVSLSNNFNLISFFNSLRALRLCVSPGEVFRLCALSWQKQPPLVAAKKFALSSCVKRKFMCLTVEFLCLLCSLSPPLYAATVGEPRSDTVYGNWPLVYFTLQ